MSMLKFVTVTKRKPGSDMEAGDRVAKRDVKTEEEIKKTKEETQGGNEEDDNACADNERAASKFEYAMKKGDLFSCSDDHSLAHCISADVRLGKGIATLFRNKFGGIDDLKKQGAKTGGLAVLKRGRRYIYNLVTKDKYFQKPTYKTLESSLLAMKSHCLRNNVSKLAMPMIGCGLDGLEWKRVEQEIKDVFGDTDLTITVYRL